MSGILVNHQISDTDWDAFVASAPSGHLLQTTPWAQLKSEFGWRSERLSLWEEGQIVAGACVLYRPLALGWTLAYVPKGPVVDTDSQSPVPELWTALRARCRANRAVVLKIEPNVKEGSPTPPWLESAVAAGFRPSPQTVQPRRSIEIDINLPEATILKNMKSKTRYNIRLAERKGVQVHVGGPDDIETFCRLMTVTGERDNFGVRSGPYYQRAHTLFAPQGAVRLLIATVEGQPIAGLLAFACGDKAWYMYGASSNERRETMPNYALQWAAIRWARDLGCRTYDLYGVPDEDLETLEAGFAERSDGLWGVYRFKRGFGGQLVRSVGAYDLPGSRPLYWLYERLVAIRKRRSHR